MLTVRYFAYGSNINIERLRRRVALYNKPLEAGVPYTLQDYRLVFNTMGFANIEPSHEDSVQGILYNLSPEQFEILDKYELLYEKQYFQINAQEIGCVYIANPNRVRLVEDRPNLEYLNLIIDGCLETGLMPTYNKLVQYKLKNYKLKRNKHKLL